MSINGCLEKPPSLSFIYFWFFEFPNWASAFLAQFRASYAVQSDQRRTWLLGRVEALCGPKVGDTPRQPKQQWKTSGIFGITDDYADKLIYRMLRYGCWKISFPWKRLLFWVWGGFPPDSEATPGACNWGVRMHHASPWVACDMYLINQVETIPHAKRCPPSHKLDDNTNRVKPYHTS